MKNKNHKPTIESEVQLLSKKIQEQNEKTVKECYVEVQKVLTKYNCMLWPTMILTPDGTKGKVDVIINIKN